MKFYPMRQAVYVYANGEEYVTNIIAEADPTYWLYDLTDPELTKYPIISYTLGDMVISPPRH